jgi:hypothetical protein
MNKEQATAKARALRNETISELGYLIADLQKDYDRLTKAVWLDDDSKGMTAHQGNTGYYLSQHCLRYEQTVKAGVKMDEWARLAQWIED